MAREWEDAKEDYSKRITALYGSEPASSSVPPMTISSTLLGKNVSQEPVYGPLTYADTLSNQVSVKEKRFVSSSSSSISAATHDVAPAIPVQESPGPKAKPKIKLSQHERRERKKRSFWTLSRKRRARHLSALIPCQNSSISLID